MVCVGSTVRGREVASAAVLSASSLVLIVLRSVLCCVTATWRAGPRVTLLLLDRHQLVDDRRGVDARGHAGEASMGIGCS